MGWVFVIMGGLAGAVLSGGLTYTTMLAREAIVVQGAVKIERDKGVVICNARVGEIERATNAAVSAAVEEARAAAAAVPDTPADKAAILELCAKSASCRERGKP